LSERSVAVEINEQQAELLDRLVAAGVGASRSEVIHHGFVGFCEDLVAQLEPDE
jgi:Arc/MetJ-type ribon-helix-helix transcriptional regulator